MIEANNLTKLYGKFIAAQDVTFSVQKGEVAAFLGPNGAGKSTTLKMLTGYLAPTKGSAAINGVDVHHNRLAAAETFGYLPENGPLYETMTPREMLSFVGRTRKMDSSRIAQRIEELKELCALSRILDRPIYKLSKGNRQRVGLAQAMIHEPETLILDEPMTGLDPNQIRAMRDLIRNYAKKGAVLLSTHILQEVEALADKVVFIDEGKLVFTGTVKELLARGPDLDSIFSKMTSSQNAKAMAASTGGAE